MKKFIVGVMFSAAVWAQMPSSPGSFTLTGEVRCGESLQPRNFLVELYSLQSHVVIDRVQEPLDAPGRPEAAQERGLAPGQTEVGEWPGRPHVRRAEGSALYIAPILASGARSRASPVSSRGGFIPTRDAW